VECLTFNFWYPGRDLNPAVPGSEGLLLIPSLCSVYLSYVKRLCKFFIKCDVSLQVMHCLLECRSEHGEWGVLGYCPLIVSEHWNFTSLFIKY
jgi:hypothetical protein